MTLDDERRPRFDIDDEVDEVQGETVRREDHAIESLMREAMRERYGDQPPEEPQGEWPPPADVDPEDVESVLEE
jgi:hypothetical protein